jgi:hypothetical protein
VGERAVEHERPAGCGEHVVRYEVRPDDRSRSRGKVGAAATSATIDATGFCGV